MDYLLTLEGNTNFLIEEKPDHSLQLQNLLKEYADKIQKIYGNHLSQIILYGSYARGDYRDDSDIDIMILLDISDLEIKKYRHSLSDMTYDFNWDNGLNIKPIAVSEYHFNKWRDAYPFYNNVYQEGVCLYHAAR